MGVLPSLASIVVRGAWNSQEDWKRIVCPGFLMFCLLSTPLHAQTDSGVVLHSDTRLVEIDVTVRDSAGKPVENLQQGDFTVFDNGKPRPFTIFSANHSGGNAPGESGPETPGRPAEVQPARPPLPAGFFTNTGESPVAPPDQHSTIILIDGVNGWFESFVWGAKGVQGLMNKLPAGERVALYVLTKYDGLLQLVDYTTDHELVRKAMSTFIPRAMDPSPPPGGSVDGGGMDEDAHPGVGVDENHHLDKPQPREVAYMIQGAAEMTRSSFNTFAQQLRSVPGRKSIFWLTEGLPARMIDGSHTRDKTIASLNDTKAAWDKTIAALNDANVAVNTVDEDGLDGPARKWGGGGIFSMELLAKETGGQAFFHRNDLDAAMAEGIANSRTDYTLGFYLGELDGQYHELKVRVNRKGLQLNHRLGYIAKTDAMHEQEDRKTEIESALMSPLNLMGAGITAKIDHKAGNLEIHLQLSPESLTLAQAGGAWNGKLEELFVEKKDSGELASVRQMEAFHIQPGGKADYDHRGRILTQTMRYVTGATKLVIVIRDSATGRTGSLTIPLI